MKKIKQDFAILKEQGYQPRLILEYVAEGDLRYFDGFTVTSYGFYKDFCIGATLLFLRVSDFVVFTTETLAEIRKLNGYLYTEKIQFPLESTVRHDTPLGEQKAIRYVKQNFFELVAGNIVSTSNPLSTTLDVHKDKIIIPSENQPTTIRYEEALVILCARIKAAMQDANALITTSSQGFSYFTPYKLGVDEKEKIANHIKFTPTKAEVEGRLITLTDENTETKQVYYADVHAKVLKRYAKEMPELAKILDDLDPIIAARLLAGDDEWEGERGEVIAQGTDFAPPEELSWHTYVYMLPDNQVIKMTFGDSDYADDDGVIALTELDDAALDTEYVYTPLNYMGDLMYCKVNNILTFLPSYVSKVLYQDNVLTIMVNCVAHCGDQHISLAVPLHLIPQDYVKCIGDALTYSFNYGTLSLPLTYYQYLDTNETLEDCLDKEILDTLVPPKQYEQVDLEGYM